MITKRYQCPECEAQFRYDHHPSIEADPVRHCPRCGFSIAEEFEPALVAPHIATHHGKSVDTLYKEMELGAEFRAQQAQEQHGLDTQAANAMKLTDMRDDARYGETSDVPVANPVTQVMDQAPPNTFGFQGANGLQYSTSVAEGPFPNAGARAQAALRRHHAANIDPRQTGATSSSLPALETTNPGYRKRVR